MDNNPNQQGKYQGQSSRPHNPYRSSKPSPETDETKRSKKTALAIAANLAVDKLEAEWRQASQKEPQFLWQQINNKQHLGEVRLYQALHAFVFNDDYQPNNTVLRDTDLPRLHEMFAVLQGLRNLFSHWHGRNPSLPDELTGLLCMRFEQAVKQCAGQNQFALFSYEELVSGFYRETDSHPKDKPVDYRRTYLVFEQQGRTHLTEEGQLFFLSFFLTAQQLQRLLDQLPGYKKTYKVKHLFRRAVFAHFTRRDAHSGLGLAAASRDDEQIAASNKLFYLDELVRTAQTLVDLPEALSAPSKTPPLSPELAHELGIYDEKKELHQSRWLRRGVAFLVAQLVESDKRLAHRLQWRSRPRHDGMCGETETMDDPATPELLGKSRPPRRAWIASDELDTGLLAVDHGHVHLRLPVSQQPPLFVVWKLHARAVRAMLEAHFLYGLPIKGFIEKIEDESQKWQHGKPFQFLQEQDLPPKLRRFPETNPSPVSLDTFKQRVNVRLQSLINRMDKVKAGFLFGDDLQDPRPERASTAIKRQEASLELQIHNQRHHRHAKNRLVLRVYQSLLPQAHKLTIREIQTLSIYHYTLHYRHANYQHKPGAGEAERSLLEKTRDVLSHLPKDLQTLVNGDDSKARSKDVNELVSRVVTYAQNHWRQLQQALPGYTIEQTIQLARVLHVAVLLELTPSLGNSVDIQNPPQEDRLKSTAQITPPAFALPLTRVAISHIAKKLAAGKAEFHASTRAWALGLRQREAERFATRYYQNHIEQAKNRKEQGQWEDYWTDAAVLSAIAHYWHGQYFPLAIGKVFFDAKFLDQPLEIAAGNHSLKLSLAETARLRLFNQHDKLAKLLDLLIGQGKQAEEVTVEDLRKKQQYIHHQGREVIEACLQLEQMIFPKRPNADPWYYSFPTVLKSLPTHLGVSEEDTDKVQAARDDALHLDIFKDLGMIDEACRIIKTWLDQLVKSGGNIRS